MKRHPGVGNAPVTYPPVSNYNPPDYNPSPRPSELDEYVFWPFSKCSIFDNVISSRMSKFISSMKTHIFDVFCNIFSQRCRAFWDITFLLNVHWTFNIFLIFHEKIHPDPSQMTPKICEFLTYIWDMSMILLAFSAAKIHTIWGYSAVFYLQKAAQKP